MYGGDMKNLLNHQYEREYIMKAKENDLTYQKTKNSKVSVFESRGFQETLANRKRNESNQRRLKIIS